MLLISLAFAGTAANAAPGLLRSARAMRPPETWLDADAWTWQDVRPVVTTIVGGVADARKTGPVRALANDPAARARKAKEATEQDVHATVECTIVAGTKMWAASPAVPPETQPWWPGRAQLLHVAVVPLSCPSATPYVALALTETDGVGWRIAAFVGKDELTDWYGIAEEAGHDLVAERALAREESRRAVKLPVVTRWEPPSLARIQTVDRDLDGDGIADAFVRYPELYGSATGTITYLDLHGGRGRMVSDEDGDGRAELLVATKGVAEVWRGGRPTSPRALKAVPAEVSDWAEADIDGDGRSDIVALADGYALVWFGGASIPTGRLEFPTPVTYVDHAGDLDGDGLGDLVFYNPDYDGQRGVGLLVHGGRAGGLPRATTFVGEPHDRVGESVSYTDLDGDGKLEILQERWDGVARRSVVEVLSGEGEILPNPLPPDLLGDSCDIQRVTDMAGDDRAELVAWCVDELRIWSPETGTRHVPLPPGTAPGLVLATSEGLRIGVLTRKDLRLVALNGTYETATVVPRPGDPPAWTVAGRRPPSAEQMRDAPFHAAPRPDAIKLPVGTAEMPCIVRASVGIDGRLLDLSFGECPDEARANAEAAVRAVSWYPLENMPGPIRFDFRFLFRP